jgi:hypothetical protein
MMCMALVPAHTATAVSGRGTSPAGYAPAALREAYGLTSASTSAGHGETVAVVDAYNDPHAGRDLAVYRAEYGLPVCGTSSGCLVIANQAGHAAPLPARDGSGGWELEESVDLDMVSAICPNCRILLVEAKSASISDLATAERYAARAAAVVSNSWGSGAEFIGENAFDADFNWPGKAIVAASGDAGYGTQYPAAAQFVTAVGGTTLTGATGGSAGTQQAWVGSGSGCSSLEAKPSWQAGDDSAPGGCENRTETDVSADANPATGVAVYDTVPDGGTVPGWTPVGGTSVATPIIASAYALAGRPAPGSYPSSYPYRNAADLADVTSGSNGRCERARQYLCRARVGYDGPTGLGTPMGTSGFAAPAAPLVTVIDPGTRDYQAGSAVRLPIEALDGAGKSLSYTSTPLPSGLRLDPADGLIAGQLTSGPGSYSVRLTATAAGAGPGSTRFTIVVVGKMADRRPGAGQVRLDLAGRCLADTTGSTASGTKIGISSCGAPGARNWEYVTGPGPGEPGLMKFLGSCLSVQPAASPGAAAGAMPGPGVGRGAGSLAGLSARRGAGAVLRPCTGSADQQWAYRPLDHLYNPRSGKCLADPASSRRNGTRVVLSACGAGDDESWLLPPGPVLSGLTGQCLTDPGDSAASGTRTQAAACAGSSAQKWVIERDGRLRIRGKCLSVSARGLGDGAAIELARCSRSAGQRWLSGPDGELLNGASGRCLADPASKAASGTGLVQEDCYGEPGEIWAIS